MLPVNHRPSIGDMPAVVEEAYRPAVVVETDTEQGPGDTVAQMEGHIAVDIEMEPPAGVAVAAYWRRSP